MKGYVMEMRKSFDSCW